MRMRYIALLSLLCILAAWQIGSFLFAYTTLLACLALYAVRSLESKVTEMNIRLEQWIIIQGHRNELRNPSDSSSAVK
jgi:hypothetical protein